MSTVSISYSSLKDASNEAKSVAKKLGKYADSLYDNVYKKLNNYGGNWTSNLAEARSKTSSKINELRSEQSRYNTYASDLIGLRDECQSVDRAVRSKVSSLTASFKEAHGIKNGKIENAINYFFTGLGNGTAFGRWLGGKKDDFDSSVNRFKDSIKEWYNYDGGKDLINGVLVGLLEVAVGVLTIAGAILSGGALIVVIAGVVGGIIAAANGIGNIWNEWKAYSSTRNNDPATGKRRSKINSWQDYLRSSFAFYDSEYYDSSNENEARDYVRYYSEEGKRNEAIATRIDITSFACTAITLISSCGQLINRGLKWANGTAKIPFKDYFKPSTYGNFFKEAWGGLSNNAKHIFESLKAGDWTFLKTSFKNFKFDFADNFKQKFLNFDSFKNGIKSTKSILSVGKDVIKGEDSLGKILITKIVLPSIAIFKPNEMMIESDTKYYLFSPTGQIKLNLKHVVLDDFYSIFYDMKKKVIDNTLFKKEDSLDLVLDTLSVPSKINISVPVIDIPEFDVPAMRIAYSFAY